MAELRFGKLQRQLMTGKVLKAKDDNYEKSFWVAIRPVIIVSQFFGLFPISNLNSNNPKFEWKSLRTLFSIGFVITSFVVAFSVIYHQNKAGKLSPSNVAGFIFFFNCSFACALFFKLAKNFNFVISKWEKVENSLRASSFNENLNSWSLKRRISVSVGIALGTALIEHLLSVATHVAKYRHEVYVCNFKKAGSSDVEEFISKQLYYIFNSVNYNHFFGFLGEYFNVSCTFVWNFLDIFIMIISIGLAHNYEQINNRLKFFRGRAMPESVWINVRKDYTDVAELVNFVDNEIAKLIVLSCCNDAYFVINQLMNLSNSHVFTIDAIYYYASTVFIITRTSTMFLFASKVYENSRKPLKIIRSIPNQGWHLELNRFSDQIRNETNALSGMKFFFLTRKVLFALAGSIVTYELVLLQFNTSDSDKKAWFACNIG